MKRAFFFTTALAILGCGKINKDHHMQFEESPEAAVSLLSDSLLNKLNERSYYFGHKSVGRNIMDGMTLLLANNSKLTLKIAQLPAEQVAGKGYFYHSEVGVNGDPSSKINAFRDNIEHTSLDSLHVAFFKFCYADFREGTPVESVFNEYAATLDDLKKRYPSITFVHVTTPLRAIQTGPKAIAKRLLGKSVGLEDNLARMQYNQLLVDKYGATDPVFDLAAIESTFPDGTRHAFDMDGKQVFGLVPAYTDDGGHLTEIGKTLVASKLIAFLSSLP